MSVLTIPVLSGKVGFTLAERTPAAGRACDFSTGMFELGMDKSVTGQHIKQSKNHTKSTDPIYLGQRIPGFSFRHTSGRSAEAPLGRYVQCPTVQDAMLDSI